MGERKVCFSALSIKTTEDQKAVKVLGLENLERAKERALPLLQLILVAKHDPKTTQRDRGREREILSFTAFYRKRELFKIIFHFHSMLQLKVSCKVELFSRESC